MSASVIPATTSNGQRVLIFKEVSSQTKGKDVQRNNIYAAKLIAEIVKTTLGPKGMDKMLVDVMGDVTITTDGAAILKEMDMQHPAAKMLESTNDLERSPTCKPIEDWSHWPSRSRYLKLPPRRLT